MLIFAVENLNQYTACQDHLGTTDECLPTLTDLSAALICDLIMLRDLQHDILNREKESNDWYNPVVVISKVHMFNIQILSSGGKKHKKVFEGKGITLSLRCHTSGLLDPQTVSRN